MVSHHLTYAESLALLDTLLGFGYTVPALKELSSPGGSENQPVANCLSLLLWLSLWGNSHSCTQGCCRGDFKAHVGVCPDDGYMSFLFCRFSSEWVSRVRRCHWFGFHYLVSLQLKTCDAERYAKERASCECYLLHEICFHTSFIGANSFSVLTCLFPVLAPVCSFCYSWIGISGSRFSAVPAPYFPLPIGQLLSDARWVP